jgi:inner membrane protein
MDSLSQAVLGASVSLAILGNSKRKAAAISGAIIATLPDLDVLLLPLLDEVSKISIHRSHSHSIFFCLLGAVVLSAVLKRSRWFKEVKSSALFFMISGVLITHILLDAFTTYGTQLFLPFSRVRIGFDSITIVDPLYTLPLLAGVILALSAKRIRSQLWVRLGLVVSSLYLVFTLVNKQFIKNKFLYHFAQPVTDILTVPVSAGSLLWYAVIRNDAGMYMSNYSVFDSEGPEEWIFFPDRTAALEQFDEEIVDLLSWSSQEFYIVTDQADEVRVYNMQFDMQGIQNDGYIAPTLFYYRLKPGSVSPHGLSSGMHPISGSWKDKWERIVRDL